jgi:hypothetical protein
MEILPEAPIGFCLDDPNFSGELRGSTRSGHAFAQRDWRQLAVAMTPGQSDKVATSMGTPG